MQLFSRDLEAVTLANSSRYFFRTSTKHYALIYRRRVLFASTTQRIGVGYILGWVSFN